MAKKSKQSGFTGAKIHFGQSAELLDVKKTVIRQYDDAPATARQWVNRRPICPYGCGEEGTLLEIVMKDGKAVGIYTHSESVKPFVAELQMAPKPTGRKIVLGPDGNYTLQEETSQSG